MMFNEVQSLMTIFDNAMEDDDESSKMASHGKTVRLRRRSPQAESIHRADQQLESASRFSTWAQFYTNGLHL